MKKLTCCLLVILFIFIAQEAGAECAWVLWLNTDENQVKVWDIIGTELNAKFCQQKLSKRFKLITEWNNTTVLLSTEREAIIEWKNLKDNTHVTIELICLPDTIDPRGK